MIVFLFTLVLIILVYWLFNGCYPVKYAIKPKDLAYRKDPFFLAKHTYEGWRVIGNQTDLYIVPLRAVFCGEIPDIISNSEFAFADNVYICYGEYIGEVEFMNGSERKYLLTGWDIQFPIKRNIYFWLPNSYICRFDINGQKKK